MFEKPTGKTRYRSGWRGKLILQVEVLVSSVDTCPMTCDSHTFQTTKWRDARVEDLPCLDA